MTKLEAGKWYVRQIDGRNSDIVKAHHTYISFSDWIEIEEPKIVPVKKFKTVAEVGAKVGMIVRNINWPDGTYDELIVAIRHDVAVLVDVKDTHVVQTTEVEHIKDWLVIEEPVEESVPTVRKFRHKKSGNIYKFVGVALCEYPHGWEDCVIYEYDGKRYVREYLEFYEKFEEVK